ncbi:MAG: FHA domain-containing protein [Wenzhouxiangella sp.]
MKISFKNKEHAEVEVKEGRLTIGRDGNNDIVLDHEDISGFHAEIHHDNGKISLVDLASKNGTWHQGRQIKGRVELKAWDEISFASVKAELVDPDRRRPTKAMRSVTDEDMKSPASPAASPPGTTPAGDIDKTKARPSVSGWVLLGLSDEVKGSKVPLSGSITVGRDQACELTLPNEMASRHHARLSVDGSKLFVEDLGSTNGTWINGKKTNGRSEVQSGDELRFDTTRYKATLAGTDLDKTAARPSVQATAARPAVQAGMPARLKPDGGRPIELRGATTIGRLPDNDVVLDDDTVSGHHARMEPDGDNWKVIDLGSSNGTEVDGKEIKQSVLKGGERIAFGEVELTFEAARSSGTRHVKSVDADTRPRTGTRKQKAVPETRERSASVTRTSKRAISSKLTRLPAWAWGLVGFLAVILIVGAWLFRENLGFPPQQIDAPLQAGTSWRHHLGDDDDRRRVISTPAIADINGDGVLDLIVADADGHVTAFDGHEGQIIFSTPLPGRIIASVAVADLTANGAAEVIVGTNNGRVFVLNASGQIVWESPGDLGLGEITNRPVLVDVNGDGIRDVIVPTSRRGLVALDGERGWKIWSTEEMSSGSVLTTPAVGDFNNDRVTDFVYLTERGQAVAVSAAEGRVWKLWTAEDLGAVDYASPALIDVERQQLVVVATRSGVSALHADSGRTAWSVRTSGRYLASPIGISVAERRVHDVLVVDNNGTARLLSGRNGDEIWDTSLGSGVAASPAAFDFTDNRSPDVVVQTLDGWLRVIDSRTGRSMLEVRVGEEHPFTASPVLGDLTGDGLLEVTAIDEDGRVTAYSFNRRVRTGRAPWPVLLGNDQHSARR